MRLIIEAMPGRCIVAGRLTEDNPGTNLCTLSGELRFRDAYLFSTPGETGNVRIADASPILDNLALGGVPEDTRANLAKALCNLDYKVLRVVLRRDEDGGDSSLSLMLRGSATSGETTVPVNLDVTFRGDLDQLLDTGMKFTKRR